MMKTVNIKWNDLLWFEITLALTDVSGKQFSLSTGSDYDDDDDDDDDKVNQD